ncbi:SDR family NAD(P)-dependent oxidoreductase [Pantoea agglomerans]|nr:SDR family NAD(P)-dependent oxidoreductase [Pantoea agglomerans]MDH1170836.1 SDR family NAD(P)-dependent oxidoreductase [Pantoea agglomerans]
MNYLQQKTAIITGASSGIGAATALELARHGVNIVAAALDQNGLDTLVRQIEAEGGTRCRPGNRCYASGRYPGAGEVCQ